MLASHPLMKLVYWDEALMRNVDPMHTIGNEVKAIVEMAMGGTGRVPAYCVSKLPQLAKYECGVNNRWQDILAPYLTGRLARQPRPIVEICCKHAKPTSAKLVRKAPIPIM